MKKTALFLLTTGLAVACGSSGARSNAPHHLGTTVQAYGLFISVPDGWEGRVYQLSPDNAITLEVASVELPPRGELMTGDRLGVGDTYIAIADIGVPPAREAEGSLPLAVDPEAIDGPYEGGFPSGVAFLTVVNDRGLQVWVFFGSRPNTRQIDAVNDVLAGFSASPPD